MGSVYCLSSSFFTKGMRNQQWNFWVCRTPTLLEFAQSTPGQNSGCRNPKPRRLQNSSSSFDAFSRPLLSETKSMATMYSWRLSRPGSNGCCGFFGLPNVYGYTLGKCKWICNRKKHFPRLIRFSPSTHESAERGKEIKNFVSSLR